MRRVLVPLDGSGFAEAIIPDARRLAGSDGELILVREASWPIFQREIFVDTSMLAVEDAERYLQQEAEKLRAEGLSVRTQSLILAHAASAIDEAVRIFDADMIAIATHARGPLGRLLHGSTAWRALAHSPVPVLLRHLESGAAPGDGGDCVEEKRRIMVPLDGSAYAEKALPVAQELALEWDAQIWLVQVVPDFPIADTTYTQADFVVDSSREDIEEVQRYLDGIAASSSVEAHTHVSLGAVTETLVECVDRFSISDTVMASHGWTGLSRVVLGSVTDDLLHRLHIPIIVIPVLAAGRLEAHPEFDQRDVPLAVSSGNGGA